MEVVYEPPSPAPDREATSDRLEAVRSAARTPRLLALCSAAALAGGVFVSVGVAIAMFAPRIGSVAVGLMLAGAVAIVGAMVVATFVSLHPPEGGDRSSIFA
jgi:uncharacterized protein with ACT and thioredoxin-like domain